MYYEYLIKNAGALSQAVQMEKKAMSPAKVLPVLEKFKDVLFRGAGPHLPRVNPINYRLKGSITPSDVADIVSYNAGRSPSAANVLSVSNNSILRKQYPYLTKLMEGRMALDSLVNNRSAMLDADGGFLRRMDVSNLNKALSTNSPTLRKAVRATV